MKKKGKKKKRKFPSRWKIRKPKRVYTCKECGLVSDNTVQLCTLCYVQGLGDFDIRAKCDICIEKRESNPKNNPSRYNQWNEIEPRQVILTKLGFKNYPEYVSSYLWRIEIRPAIIDKFENICQSCGVDMMGKRITRVVHHREYTEANLSGESQEGLTLVCTSCHNSAHSYKLDGYNARRSIEETNKWIDKTKPKREKQRKSKYKNQDYKNKKEIKNCQTEGCQRSTTKKLCNRCKKYNSKKSQKRRRLKKNKKQKGIKKPNCLVVCAGIDCNVMLRNQEKSPKRHRKMGMCKPCSKMRRNNL
jgi:hypothetical protein